MSELPSGTVTFLFTDLVGSTRLWEQQPEYMQQFLAEHDGLLYDAVTTKSGRVVKTTGDGLHAVFANASDALLAAAEMQATFANTSREPPAPSIRIGIHTGEAELRDGDYFGTAVNRAARIAATAHGGQILCSGATAELVQDQPLGAIRLVDLGMHRLRDLSRPEHVWQVVRPGLREHFPPLRTGDQVPGNLPTFLDDFIGRDDTVRELAELLHEARLVTLVGVGGVGKTRLAVHTAAAIADGFPDGTWFVHLGTIGDPSFVSAEIAGALGVAETPGRSLLDLIVDVLTGRQALLVIDNCEHLLDSTARIIEQLLTRVGTLRVLATSREGLMIRGERIWPVPSVAPEAAARLFASRASAVRPNFEITDTNAESIDTICARLDGIPLAIELAASRVASMTPDDIAANLDERFRLLTGGNRTALERHQTLRRAVDWSYELLDADERRLFRCLSVFTGSCTLEAVAAVTEVAARDQFEVADQLAGLSARSLVIVDESGTSTRYRMLETLRAYGRELLDGDGDTDIWRARHAAYYCDLAERIHDAVKGADELLWMARFDAEQDDLRAALRWSLDAGEHEIALRIVAALAWTWWERGAVSEGERAIEAVMDGIGSVRIDLQAELVIEWVLFAQQHVDWDSWDARCRLAIELAERAHVTAPRAYALLGMVESFRGHRESALEYIDRARHLALDVDEWEWGYTTSCSVHALVALGDYDVAAPLGATLVVRMRELGNPTRIADALMAYGLAIAPADPRDACEQLSEAAEIFDAVGNLPMGGGMVSNGVQLALSIGDIPLAASFVRRRIATVRQSRDYAIDPFLPLFALHVAAVLHAAGSLTDAAVLLGASDALMQRTSAMYILPGARVRSEPELRAALSTDEFAAARELGHSLDRDAILELAESSLGAVSEAGPLERS